MSESTGSGSWIRWGLGLVSTLGFLIHITLLSFILQGILRINVVDERTVQHAERIHTLESNQTEMLDAVTGLRVEMARLTEALRANSAGKGKF